MLGHSAEVGLELQELGLHRHALLGREQGELALGVQPAQVVQPLDPLADRVVVGQQAAQPALVHVRHAGLLGDLLDDVLGLLLRADEQDDAPARGEVLRERPRLLEQLDRLHQVDDVDPLALAEDVAAHLRMPAAGLVPEMDAGLQQLLDSDFWQNSSLFWQSN